MGVQGWQLTISTGTYRTPSFCSSCLGPRETQLEATVSEKSGNIRTTLKMAFPYCHACAARARRESRRAGFVIGGGVVFGLLFVFAAGAFMAGDLLDPILSFVIGILLAMGIATGIAFATRPGPPPAPATATGEAVILRDTGGTVLCTNQRFAEMLGEANSATPKPGSTFMTTEMWAPLAALFVGVFVTLLWAKYAPRTFDSSPSPPPRPVQIAVPKKATPAPAPRATQPARR